MRRIGSILYSKPDGLPGDREASTSIGVAPSSEWGYSISLPSLAASGPGSAPASKMLTPSSTISPYSKGASSGGGTSSSSIIRASPPCSPPRASGKTLNGTGSPGAGSNPPRRITSPSWALARLARPYAASGGCGYSPAAGKEGMGVAPYSVVLGAGAGGTSVGLVA